MEVDESHRDVFTRAPEPSGHRDPMQDWNLQFSNWVTPKFLLVSTKNTLQSGKRLQLFSLLVGSMVNRRLALVFDDGKNTP